MIGIRTNARQVQRVYDARAARWAGAVTEGFRAIAVAADRGSEKNLRGGDAAPRSYPVPNPTGTLRRGGGIAVFPRSSVVFNSVQYARAVHQGYRPYGNQYAALVPARLFQDDAVAAIDPAGIMQARLANVL